MDGEVFEMTGPGLKVRRLKRGDQDMLHAFFQTLGERTTSLFHPHPFDKDTGTSLGKRGLRLNGYDDNHKAFKLYTRLGFQVATVSHSMRLAFER